MDLALGVNVEGLVEYLESRRSEIETRLESAIKGYEGEGFVKLEDIYQDMVLDLVISGS